MFFFVRFLVRRKAIGEFFQCPVICMFQPLLCFNLCAIQQAATGPWTLASGLWPCDVDSLSCGFKVSGIGVWI